MKWISKHKGLLGILILAVMAISFPATLGLTWIRDVGLLSSDAVAFASDAPAMDRVMANALKGVYGSRVQVCDGTADDVEINAAIGAVLTAGGGDIRLTSGTFNLANNVNLGSGSSSELIVEGAGISSTTLYWQGGVGGKMLNLDYPGSYYTSVRDLTVCASGTLAAYGVYVNSANQFKLENVNIDGETAPGLTTGLYITTSSFTTISSCRIYAQSYAARINNCAYVAMHGSGTCKVAAGGTALLGEGYSNDWSVDGIGFMATSDNGTGINIANPIACDFTGITLEQLTTGVTIAQGRDVVFTDTYCEDITGTNFVLGDGSNLIRGITIDGVHAMIHDDGQAIGIDVVSAVGASIQGYAVYDDERVYSTSWLRVGNNCEVDLGPSGVYNATRPQKAPSVAAGATVTGWHVPNLTGDLIQENVLTGADSWVTVTGNTWKAKVFTVTDNMTLLGVSLGMKRYDTPSTVTVSIRAVTGAAPDGVPTGANIASGTTNGDTLWLAGYPLAERVVRLTTPVNLDEGTQYAIIVNISIAMGNSASMRCFDHSDSTHYGVCTSADAGASWSSVDGYDMAYELWGYLRP